MSTTLPRYPVYIPSKGRADRALTPKFMLEDGLPFKIVVEPQEHDAYAARYGEELLLTLPFRDKGLPTTRNWIRDYSQQLGFERHWQIDDNIRSIRRRYRCKRIRVESGPALAMVEDFTERYTNVGLTGLNYEMFLPDNMPFPPFYHNSRVYSCTLFWNAMPFRFRGTYNEDVDMCLQVLSSGLCTLLINAFFISKMMTMKLPGGNFKELYAKQDGRLKMARALERMWPGVVTTDRRFSRPQHVVKDSWRRFDTPLILRPGLDISKLPKIDEHGLKLTQTREDIKAPELKALYSQYQEEHPAKPKPAPRKKKAAR